MYKNLSAEMARFNLTQKDIQNLLKISSQSTMSLKMNGKSFFTLDEAKKIRNLINEKRTEKVTLDYLFEI